MPRKIIILLLSGLIVSMQSGISYPSEGTLIDGMLSYGYDDFGYGNKFSAGYGIGISRDITAAIIAHPTSNKIVARMDVNYINWHDKHEYVEWSYTRVPVFVGTRLFVIPQIPALYFEAGIEYTRVKSRTHYTGPLFGTAGAGFDSSHSAFDAGLVPGLGFIISIGRKFSLDLNARLHLESDFYGSLAVSAGYRF